MARYKKEHFPLTLQADYIGAGRWQLTAPFEYQSKKYGVIRVPIGAISDGASIPQFAFSLIGGRWTGKYVEGSIIHDHLYKIQIYTRRKSDKIFLEAMKNSGVSFWKRRLMFLAVRFRGWIPWNKQRRKK